MRYLIFSVSCVVSVALLGCTSTAPVKPDEKPVEQVESLSEMSPDPSILTPEETRALIASLGCPESLITDTGCKQCPTVNQGEYDQDLPARTADDPVEVTFEFGTFVGDEPRQVLASYDGCGELVGGAHRVTDMVHLRQKNDGVWVPQSAARIQDLVSCQLVPGLFGWSRSLCQSLSGRMGEYMMQYTVVIWSNEPDETEQPTPAASMQVLLEEWLYESCSENSISTVDVDWSVASEQEVAIDTMGSVLKADITRTDGPFVGNLEACPDGDFEAPLTPEREEQIEEEVLYFLPGRYDYEVWGEDQVVGMPDDEEEE